MRVEFSDIQEAAEELPGLQLEFQQIDSGPLELSFQFKGFDDISVTKVNISSRVEGIGEPLPERVCCVICTGGSAAHLYDGVPLDPGDVFLRTTDVDRTHQILHPGYESWIIDLPRKLVFNHLNQAPEDVWGPSSVLKLRAEDRMALWGGLNQFDRMPLGGSIDERVLADEFVAALCSALSSQTLVDLPKRRAEKYALAYSIRELLHECRDLTMGDICAKLRIPGRTQRRIFSEVFGVSPAYYHKILRLNRARAELKSCSPGPGRVSGIATRNGFWHMGRFSIHYKELFCESPSATLRA